MTRLFYFDDQHRQTGVEDALGNLSQTVYDGQDHVVMTISPLNETNQFVYDGNNNLLSSIDPLGIASQFIYDNQFNMVRSVDGVGNSSGFAYNAQFSVIGSTNGAGDVVTYVYNSNGTLATNSSGGFNTIYKYDANGYLSGITYPGGLGSEGFLNNTYGDVLNRTNGRGFVTSFQYNNRRELTNTMAPTNLTASVYYDAAGNVIATKDPRGYVTSFSWSATGKKIGATLPPMPAGVPLTTNYYDSRDWLIRTVDPLQHAVQYTNDIAGRLAAVTDPLLRTAKFGYDSDGRQIASTNAANEATHNQFNPRGELTKLTDNAGHTVLRAYDGTGNQITLTNRNGKVWQFKFDGANRLTNTITPLGRETKISFDNRGLVKSILPPSNQGTTNYYDPKGRLTNRVDGVGSTVFKYDAGDNLTNVVEPAASLSWTYDAYNRVSSFKDVYGNLFQYRYDLNGNLTNLIYPGGKNVYYAYDSNNHLTNVTDWSNRKTSLAYDLAGHLTTVTRPNGTVRTIDYDTAGQTTNIWEKTGAGTPIALFKLDWNAAARAEWEFAAPLPHAANIPTRTMEYNDDNQLTKVNGQNVYSEADGNLTNAPLADGTFAIYKYDARNRLLNVGGVTNGYDPAGNRVGMASGTNLVALVVNPNAQLSQVLMRIKNGVTNYYIYGAGLLYEITETATATNTLTYHYDYRGSTVALTDNNGNVTDRIEYSLYATTTYRTGTSDTPFLFNGRYGVQTDPNGLLHMRARYYNPYLCRFLNPDPSGFSGGLNWYAYANGNPVSLLDPFGLWSWTQTFGVIRLVGALAETAVGASVGIATSWTGVGAVGGGAVALHGLDQVQASFRQIYTAQATDSLTSSGLQAAGMSKTAANLTDAGISIVGSLGAGAFNAATKISAVAATPEAAGMSTWQILNTVDKGSKALPTTVFESLGGTSTSAITKAAAMSEGAAGTEGFNLLQALGLAGTGLTPLADIGAGIIGVGGGAAQFYYNYPSSVNK